MSREWKPGDVAISKGHVIFRAELVTGEPRWHDKFGVLGRDDTWPTTPQIRPLVVIDPEDREQVERLTHVFYEVRGLGSPALAPDRVTNMQAALREFADPKPPKPAEPTGLGAVVEDTGGVLWVRAGKSYTDPNWRVCGGSEWIRYADIPAVRVLSEGVS